MPSTWPRIYAIVARIPRGRVATYGQVALLAGLPRAARQVGYALAALPADLPVPWQRVVNARGEISLRAASHHEVVQRELLRREGVGFDEQGRIPLGRFQWRPTPKLGARRSSSRSASRRSGARRRRRAVRGRGRR
ncbi:MAG TPA: MGMT family protein [Planctomycetota bacterium]|nr:MGMT family protein [Planctomycetota bacterium]